MSPARIPMGTGKCRNTTNRAYTKPLNPIAVMMLTIRLVDFRSINAPTINNGVTIKYPRELIRSTYSAIKKTKIVPFNATDLSSAD